jgi:hypothetical protein
MPITLYCDNIGACRNVLTPLPIAQHSHILVITMSICSVLSVSS